jgi:citrate synthase
VTGEHREQWDKPSILIILVNLSAPGAMMADLLSAREAAARLGVSRQTLYAYVSRGLLQAHGADDPRQRRYAADAIDRLAAERRRGRRPKEIAKATLDWGLPVLESGITLIRDGRLWYRGADAVALAETGSVEDVAALLWKVPRGAAFEPHPPVAAAGTHDAIGGSTGAALPGDLLTRFAILSAGEETTGSMTDPARGAAEAGALVRLLAAAIVGRRPDNRPIHRQCARAWGLDEAGADLVRRALVLCADHELNASSFAVRCVASTGAGLRSALLAGLAALTGPRHGGTTARVEALFDAFSSGGAAAAQHFMDGGAHLPGFGHPLYPKGDPRVAPLLAPILSTNGEVAALVQWVGRITAQQPSLDFALVAARRHLRLVRGTAFDLFALGRSVGWIAHAIEEHARGQLIRPRALYTGPNPST